MDNFQIETAQNVSIQQNVANLGDRILAFLLDLVIIIGFAIVTGVGLAGLDFTRSEEWVYLLIIGLPTYLYHLLWETFWNGRSPGKAALKLRVVKTDGSTPSFSNYLIRWLLRLVDISFTSGSLAVVTILFNGKGQRLGDVAARTTVISEKQRVTFQDTLQVDIPEDYVPTYPQVTVFSDHDIQEIKSIYLKAKRRNQHHVVLKLSGRISKVINVTPTETPLQFVDTVIKDYNYYTQR